MALDRVTAGCPALEAVEEDNGEVELSLGLSIGGSSRKGTRAGGGRAAAVRSSGTEAHLARSGSSSPSPPPPFPPFLQVEGADAAADAQRRREIHALRRQEARRRRDEKQQRKGMCVARNGAARGISTGFPPLGRTCSVDDRAAMEAQEHRMRVRDRATREEEEEARRCDLRAGANGELAFGSIPDHDDDDPGGHANPNPSFSPNHSNPNLATMGAHPFSVMAMQYPYPPVHYVAIADGFGNPCMMPCWAPAVSPVAQGPKPERNVFQPVPRRTFQPFSPAVVEPIGGGSHLSSNSVDQSDDGKGTGRNRALSWTASKGSTSSPATSDHQSGSLRGVSSSSSSDTRSHSSHAPGKDQPHLSPQVSDLPMAQSDDSISSRGTEPEQLNSIDDEEEPPERRSTSSNKATQGVAGEVGQNQPVPGAPGESSPTPPLPRMPCVSTTGNGPDGKTITGFLYRYTKTEVSIVCVCHGSSFTPSEFVKHAGGTDVSHPLRQITVVSP